MSQAQNRTRPTGIPKYTWLGLLVMIGAQIGLRLKIEWVVVWLTPLMWSGYILLVDGLLFRVQGKSWLTTRKYEFPLLALLSVAIWLIFEAYNFHIQNWIYRGVPEPVWVRNFAYAWSFATIIPGVFLTSEILQAVLPPITIHGKFNPLPKMHDWQWILTGLALVTIPLVLPTQIARYLFGAVWLGFIFMIDPINKKLDGPSFKQEWRHGAYTTTIALLSGGLICGFLWEAWNFQAYQNGGGHWIYLVPEQLRIFNLHYGQMPILGMLGFPPFALELYLMYHFARSMLGIDKFFGRLNW